jgi:predicted deacetylase
VFRLCVFIALAASSCAAGAITLVFRYDDFSTTSPVDLDRQVLDAFRKRNIAVTFAVIPAIAGRDALHKETALPLTPGRAAILKDALQGYSHQSIPGRLQTEFAGVDGPRQEQLLRSGREILESRLGITIRTFVPPWNSFDGQTLAALERLGFGTISAGRRYKPAGQPPLRFVPGTCELTDLVKTIEWAREFGDAHTIVVVMLHPYDFKEHDTERGRTTLGELFRLLDWVKDQPDLETRTLDEAGRADTTLTAARCRRWQASLNDPAGHCLPPFLRHPSLYLSEPGFDRLEARQSRLLAIVYATLLLGSMMLAMAATRLCPARTRRPSVPGVLTALSLGLAMYIILRPGWPVEWNWHRLAPPTVIAGLLIGVWAQWVLLRRKRT